MNIFKWIGVNILGSHCPECGAKLKKQGVRLWVCSRCDYSVEEKW